MTILCRTDDLMQRLLITYVYVHSVKQIDVAKSCIQQQLENVADHQLFSAELHPHKSKL